MTLNLLTDRWIPVLRNDGTTATIAPHELVPPEDGSAAPPVDMIPPRADFRAALHEFCIGLLQVAFAYPAVYTRAQWLALLHTPPTQADLRNAFAAHVPWFNLLGERPLFMQDFTLPPPGPKDDCSPVSALLMDAPAEGASKKNTDHFVKRDRTECLCPACAAMALYTIQTYAPEGGRGYYTSLRGGGPLSTFAVPEKVDGAAATLWHTLWANVLPLSSYPLGDDLKAARVTAWEDSVYPWGAPTRTGDTGKTVNPGDVHPFQCHWGMPRRFLLLPREHAKPVTCSLCRAQTNTAIHEVFQRPSGTNYGPTWKHPLTPYRFQKDGAPALPLKGNPGITGYAHWLGMVYGEGDTPGSLARSLNIHIALGVEDLAGNVRVRASGYDMKQNKPRQWCEGQYPVYTVSPDRLDDFRHTVRECVGHADTVKTALLQALKTALYAEKAEVKSDKTPFLGYAATFWGATEAAFYETVHRLAAPVAEDGPSSSTPVGPDTPDSPSQSQAMAAMAAQVDPTPAIVKSWVETLLTTAETIFDTAVETQPFDVRRMKNIVAARGIMRFGLRKKLKDALNPS